MSLVYHGKTIWTQVLCGIQDYIVESEIKQGDYKSNPGTTISAEHTQSCIQ